jgi:RNA polymerase sigma-70 factor (ECF subfamily)
MKNASSETTRTDPKLLDEIRDLSNQEAWEKFVVRYQPMIRGWCRQWFPHEADDKACEVLSELVFRMVTFEYKPGKGRFRGWLKTVTHNLMAKLKNSVFRQVDDGQFALELVEAGDDLAARLAAEFDLELLEIAKERVRARVESHTWLAYEKTAEQWKKPADVARELGMRVGTVFQAKHSVTTLLRREIENLQGPA